jgi:trigger factor
MSDFNITKQILEETHEILLTAEVAPERVEKEVRAMAKKLGRKMRIPGFRPGKAPANIIIARLGREYVLQEVAESMIDEAHAAAIETVQDEVASGAALRDIELEPMIYEFVAPIKPEVDLGDYRSIRVEEEPVDEAEVLKLVDEELVNLREQNKVWTPVEDRSVQYGDLVTLGIKLTVDGEEELNEEEWDFIPSETDYTMSPEFDANIVGMELGETKTFTLTFPEDAVSKWAGREGVFEVEVKAIKAEELPELTDEFVAENTEFESVEAFKEALEESVRAHLESEKEREFQKELWEAIKEEATIRYAPATLFHEVERLEAEREDLYKSYGFESTAELLKLQGKTHEQYLEELEPEAKARLEEELVLDEVVNQEKLDASDYELEQYIRGAGLSEEDEKRLIDRLKEDVYYQLYIKMLVLRRKAHELLTAIAKGEDVPEPGQHPVEEAPEEPEEAAEAEENEEAEASDEEVEVIEEEIVVVAEDEEGDMAVEEIVEEEVIVEESVDDEETEADDEASE